jgi:hypothetical protein
MSVVQERLYIEAPYTQAASAFERRLGFAPGADRGECLLALAFPAGEGRDIARVVTARSERLPHPVNYTSRYRIGWDAGLTASGIPTPAFMGMLTLRAGEDYGETELKLEGGYDPPGGGVGRVFDELIGRRIAHATLSALLSGVGADLHEAYERVEAGKQAR